MNKILAVGLNYKKHIDEANELRSESKDDFKLQDQYPNIFNKQNSSVNDPFGDVHLKMLFDSRGNLVLLLAKNVRIFIFENAKGYTVVNEIQVVFTMTMGKSWDLVFWPLYCY